MRDSGRRGQNAAAPIGWSFTTSLASSAMAGWRHFGLRGCGRINSGYAPVCIPLGFVAAAVPALRRTASPTRAGTAALLAQRAHADARCGFIRPHPLGVGAIVLWFALSPVFLEVASAQPAPRACVEEPARAARAAHELVAGAAEAPGCLGQPVVAILLRGCEGAPCGEPEVHRRLTQLLRELVGERASATSVAGAAALLGELGYASVATAACIEAGADVRVVIEVQPASLIREIDIRGAGHFYVDELFKRLFLREGAFLSPETAQGRAALERQRDTLLYLYERAGFTDTRIDVRTEDLGRGWVRLRVDIEEGARNRVDHVVVRSIPPTHEPTPAVDDAWSCHAFKPADLLAIVEQDDVEVFTERVARDIRGRLREHLQSYGWVRPEVDLAYRFEDATLTVEVSATSCYVIQFRTRGGARARSATWSLSERADWRQLMSFGSSGAFDFEEAEHNRRLLQADLEREGYLFAEVALDYRRLTEFNRQLAHGQSIPLEVEGVLTYDVTLGDVTEVRTLDMPGVHAFDVGDLLDRIETRPYDFFATGGYLRVEQLIADLETIRQLYREEGYPHMTYGLRGDTPALERKVRRRRHRTEYIFTAGDLGFRAYAPDGENVVYVEVPVEEGPHSTFAGVEVHGCGAPAVCEGAMSLLQSFIGESFSEKTYKSALRALRGHLDELGYARAAVRVSCGAEPPRGDAGECEPNQVTDASVHLRVDLDEGVRHRVGAVFVVGTFETSQDIVMRDLPPGGEWLRASSILQAERRLRNLGIFNTVNVVPMTVPYGIGTTLDVPLLARVEERPYQFLDLAIGFESFNRATLTSGGTTGRMPPFASSIAEHSVTGADRIAMAVAPAVPLNLPDLLLVGQAEYVNLNLLGSAQELRVPFKYAVSTGDPARLAAAAPTLLNRRFLGTDMVFRTTAYGVFDRANYPFDRLEGGLELELSQSFFQQLFVSGRYAVSATSIRTLPTATDPDPSFGNPLLLNKPEVRVSWEKLDTPTHPTEGFALAGRIAYLNSFDFSSSNLDNFLKYAVEGRFVFNIRKFLVFANFARLAGSVAFAGNVNLDLPVNERYYLGGNKGVRGFEDGEITRYESNGKPVDADPETEEIERVLGADYAVSGTSELRIPLGFSIGPLDVWGAGFVDWGALADSFEEFHAKSFRVTAGGGLRLLLYGRVPVRIDYGIKLDRRCRIYSGQGCDRQEDFGELEFNILYTF